jgi:hypothetical protein
LLVISLLAATNRESAAFAGLIWLCVHGWSSEGVKPLEVAKGLVLSVAAYAFVLVLRHTFAAPGEAGVQMLAFTTIPQKVKDFVEFPRPSGWPFLLVASVVPMAWFTRATWSYRTREENGLLAAAAIILAVTFVFGMIDEMRVFLTGFTIVLYANTRASARVAALIPTHAPGQTV